MKYMRLYPPAGCLVFVVAAGCLRTASGGCGGPVVSSPCQCPSAASLTASADTADLRKSENDSSEFGGTVVVHADSEPAHLLHFLRPDGWSARIAIHEVYEALLKIDPVTYELQPELAETYEVSPDGRMITFQLRRNALWHDGEPFSSADVLFTFDIIKDPSTLAAEARSTLEVIERYEAPDPHTFRVFLREPSYYLLQNLEYLVIIPRHLFRQGDIHSHPRLRRPIGTGPFRFVSWRSGREIVLERNESYWGDPARLDRVIYRFASDRTLAFQMLRSGDIDIMPRLPLEQVEQASQNASLQKTHRFFRRINPGFSFIVHNTQKPLLADHRVRQAFSMLIDRQTIRCALEKCMNQLISGPFPVGHPGGADPTVEPWPFDVAKARQTLDHAGWRATGHDGIREKNGRELRVNFLVPTVSVTQLRAASLIQQDMLRAGVHMDIHAVDWGIFLQRLRDHDFDMAILHFSLEWEADYFSIFHSSQAQGGQNYGSWSNAEADDILEKLRQELDPGQRLALQHRFLRLLHQQQPMIFLYARIENSLVHRSVLGVGPKVAWHDERFWFIPYHQRSQKGDRPLTIGR